MNKLLDVIKLVVTIWDLHISHDKLTNSRLCRTLRLGMMSYQTKLNLGIVGGVEGKYSKHY